MKESERAINTLISAISKIVKDSLANANFDKSFYGVVVSSNNGVYVVDSMGSSYTIRSTQTFTVHERVIVTALQGNFNNLSIRKI